MLILETPEPQNPYWEHHREHTCLVLSLITLKQTWLIMDKFLYSLPLESILWNWKALCFKTLLRIAEKRDHYFGWGNS